MHRIGSVVQPTLGDDGQGRQNSACSDGEAARAWASKALGPVATSGHSSGPSC